MRRTRPPEVRFAEKVEIHESGCWLWTAAKNAKGYGVFSISHHNDIGAHRWAWEQANGPIPPGLVIDHLCRVHACVNPAHMEIVTHRTNILRGEGLAAQHARKTHCKNGHEFTEANTRRSKGSDWRVCKACANAPR